MSKEYQCDGLTHCGGPDELLSLCGVNGSCPAGRFQCRWRGLDTCLSKEEYQCDGVQHCDDASDEAPSVCANCRLNGLHMCRDGSRCVGTEFLCDQKHFVCADGSDESDTWSNCTVHTQNDTVPCPGFPGNFAKICDGLPTCPDSWDELLSTCAAFDKPCTSEAGLYPCKDGSKCVGKQLLCNAFKNCDSGEDEAAEHCKDKCQDSSFKRRKFRLHECDEGSCIPGNLACSALDKPLCKDRSDMNSSLCTPDKKNGGRKCYTYFPGVVDPYRWMCEDGSKCILKTSLCDIKVDCPDQSDEKQDCPWYAKLNLWHSILICFGAVLLSLLLHLLFNAWSHSLDQHSSPSHNHGLQSTPQLPPSTSNPPTTHKQDADLPSLEMSAVPVDLPLTHDASALNPEDQTIPDSISTDTELPQGPFPGLPLIETEISQDGNPSLDQNLTLSIAPPSPTPSFLLHPALDDLEGHQWSWQDVGKELKIEVMVFNRDSQFLTSFLSKIEAQDVHPETVHRVFKGFFSHLGVVGQSDVSVAFAMRQSIGHHRLAHMALKAKDPVKTLDVKGFELSKWLEQMEGKNKVGFACVAFAKTVGASVSPFLIYFDVVKDIVLYNILHGTIVKLKESCEDVRSTCLAATPAEENLLTAMLASFTVSIVSTSLHAYNQRSHFFKLSPCFNFVLFFSSPLLPAVYHLQIASISETLEKEKKSLTNVEYQRRKQNIEKLRDIVHQSKSIEVGLEAISQILILCGLARVALIVAAWQPG